MKNFAKLFGIIALAAVIGFSMVSCGTLSLGGGGGAGGGAFGGFAAAAAEWPSNADWEARGLPGGLQQPSGTTVAQVATLMGNFTVSLNGEKAAFDNILSQLQGKSGWTVRDRQSDRQQETVAIGSDSHGVALMYSINDKLVTIMVATAE